MSSLSGDALWRRIAESLEDRIRAREYQAGDRLPPERELSREFMVNRHTVRRALIHLQQKRLIESTQGRGSFVRRPAILYQIGRRTRFSEILKDQESSPRTETRYLGIQRAGERVARALHIGLGKPVVVLERVGYAHDLPISIARHHFSHERLPDFVLLYARHQSVTATLRACGIPDYMLQCNDSLAGAGPHSGWSVYLRVGGGQLLEFAEAVRKCTALVREPERMFYGQVEFEVVDPDGHRICVAEPLPEDANVPRAREARRSA